MLRSGRAAVLAIVVLMTASGCTAGCPAALLEGVLAERDGDLVVLHEDGFEEPVNWSASHHRVRDSGGALAVVDWLGIEKAREGDIVRLGGGEAPGGGIWNICGMFEVDRAEAT